jgi:hypothetical protein
MKKNPNKSWLGKNEEKDKKYLARKKTKKRQKQTWLGKKKDKETWLGKKKKRQKNLARKNTKKKTKKLG